MQFTYTAYKQLLEKLNNNQYRFTNYHDYNKTHNDRVVILRHDIDFCLESAVKFAEMEHEMGVSSTYFVLLRTDFYNVASKESQTCIKKIKSLGHEIGLHFDEASMGVGGVLPNIIKEKELLSNICECDISTVSMHRPSKDTLEADYTIPGMINSYSRVFFNDFKYLSDSRRIWREPVFDIIDSKKYDRLHILTHAFWYKDQEEPIEATVKNFILHANEERYYQVADNIRDINSIMGVEELACK